MKKNACIEVGHDGLEPSANGLRIRLTNQQSRKVTMGFQQRLTNAGLFAEVGL